MTRHVLTPRSNNKMLRQTFFSHPPPFSCAGREASSSPFSAPPSNPLPHGGKWKTVTPLSERATQSNTDVESRGRLLRQKSQLQWHFSSLFAFSGPVLLAFKWYWWMAVFVGPKKGWNWEEKQTVGAESGRAGEKQQEAKSEAWRQPWREWAAAGEGGGGVIGKLSWAAEKPGWTLYLPCSVPGAEHSSPHRLHHCCFHNRVPRQQRWTKLDSNSHTDEPGGGGGGWAFKTQTLL